MKAKSFDLVALHVELIDLSLLVTADHDQSMVITGLIDTSVPGAIQNARSNTPYPDFRLKIIEDLRFQIGWAATGIKEIFNLKWNAS